MGLLQVGNEDGNKDAGRRSWSQVGKVTRTNIHSEHLGKGPSWPFVRKLLTVGKQMGPGTGGVGVDEGTQGQSSWDSQVHSAVIA